MTNELISKKKEVWGCIEPFLINKDVLPFAQEKMLPYDLMTECLVQCPTHCYLTKVLAGPMVAIKRLTKETPTMLHFLQSLTTVVKIVNRSKLQNKKYVCGFIFVQNLS